MITTQHSWAIILIAVGSLSFAVVNRIQHEQQRPISFIDNNDTTSRQLSSRILSPVLSTLNDPKSVTLRTDLPIEPSPSTTNLELAQLQLLKQTTNIWQREKFYWISYNGRSFGTLPPTVGDVIVATKAKEDELAAAMAMIPLGNKDMEDTATGNVPITICGREFSIPPSSICPAFTPTKPILLLTGMSARGRTGNNLVSLLHSVQYAMDNNVQLGIMSESWATSLVTNMFMENKDGSGRVSDSWAGEWQTAFESIFCAKLFTTEAELEGLHVLGPKESDTAALFRYRYTTFLGEYMAVQFDVLRRLWAHYNTGVGTNRQGVSVGDMCSGLNSIFPDFSPLEKESIYSVIHSRSMESAGKRHLGNMGAITGCDRLAALEMRPEYIKGILGPLNMLNYPIILITDGQNKEVYNRLLADPDIGKQIRLVPSDSSWIGGDIALGVTSNVFIGNPASSFGNFIAKTRMAIGMGHNENFRAKDEETGEWRTVCGDHCTFDYCP